MQTTNFLKFYRVTSGALLVALIALPFVFRHNPIFATVANTIVTLTLVVIAFQMQRLYALERILSKLDELLTLLREAKRPLTPPESGQLQQQLEQVRVGLLQARSMRRTKFSPP